MSEPTAHDATVYHVIYTSVALEKFSQLQLRELLIVSRRNNQPRGLTGLLLYQDGLFMQFLEGPKQEVSRLINILRKDTRHGNLRIVKQGNLPQRLFPEWSMAYKALSTVASSLAGFSEQLQYNFESGIGREPADLMRNLFEERMALQN